MSEIFNKYMKKAKEYNEVNIQFTQSKGLKSGRDFMSAGIDDVPEKDRSKVKAGMSRKFKLNKKITQGINDGSLDPQELITATVNFLQPMMLNSYESYIDAKMAGEEATLSEFNDEGSEEDDMLELSDTSATAPY